MYSWLKGTSDSKSNLNLFSCIKSFSNLVTNDNTESSVAGILILNTL